MDKNLIFAFLLIFASFVFFNSDFYNEKLLHKPKSASSKNTPPSTAPESKSFSKPPNASSAIIAEPKQEAAVANPDSSLLSQARTITVVGKHYKGEFSTLGALATAWTFLDYNGRKGSPVNIIPENNGGLFNLKVGDEDFNNRLFLASDSGTLVLSGKDTITFRCNLDSGRYVEKLFILDPDGYDVDVKIISNGFNSDNYRFGWKSGIAESEEKVDGSYADDPVSVFFGDDVDHPVDKKDTVKDVEGAIRWVSLRSKYFAGTFIPDKVGDYEVTFRKQPWTASSRNALNFSFEINGKFENNEAGYRIILCPNQYSILKGYDIKLEKILFKGYTWFIRADLWFPPLCGLVLNILNFFYGLIPNFGVAIILLTILSKIVTLPLTIKSTRSMARMKLLQPKIDAIRTKYKSDPLTMNKAVMKLYKDEGVNPLGAGGCLPMVLQMPIFIALFVALRKSIELRGAPFTLWITDLSGPEAMFMLPSKILFYGPNVSLLTIIMAITMFIQSKQTMTSATDPNQKMMVYIMPVVMLFALNSMPAGLVLYWALSNILGIFQNMAIKVTPEDFAAEKAKPKKPWFKKPSYNEMLRKMGRK